MTQTAAVPAAAAHVAPSAFPDRWYGKAALLALSVLALTLAPAGQFYLAWVGAVPWLYVVRRSRTPWRAFLWSWLAGTLFFLANLWWLAYVTRPGMVALVIYLGLYWGVAALILRGAGVLARHHRVLVNVLAIAAVLVGLEWVRGNLFTGLPWLYLGHSQSPILVMCQVADTLGVFGISFWVALLNALAFAWLVSPNRRGLIAATASVGGITVALFAYGIFRQRQTPSTLTPGPVVAVIQSNYPQDNSGEKGAPDAERLQFHVEKTQEAVRKFGAGNIDLACWSETMMPGLNAEYRTGMSGARLVDPKGAVIDPDYAATLNTIVDRLTALSRDYRVNLLTGSFYAADLRDPEHFLFADRRNTAYLFRPSDGMSAEHYDKIHLVPFGEFIPFKRSGPLLHWMYTFFMSFSPYNFDYTLTPGSEETPTVFTITTHEGQSVRFVTPICFEDIDSTLCAKMFHGTSGKRADLLVNLTNDGWFKANENPQHLQAAIFRSIENRVPTARSVNTGISAFIDSTGRVSDKIAAQTAGTAVHRVMLDSRYTVFTRVGDVFGILCALVTGGIAAVGVRDWRRTRRARAA